MKDAYEKDTSRPQRSDETNQEQQAPSRFYPVAPPPRVNQGGFLDHTPVVKKGDAVKKGQLLTRNNYTTEDGEVAVGRNLKVGYLAMDGWTYEDAMVMSESGAKKLTSNHIKEKTLEIGEGDLIGPKAYNAHLKGRGNQISGRNLALFGGGRVVQEGSRVQTGDVLVPAVSVASLKNDKEVTQNLQKMFKNLGFTYKDRSITWEEPFDGEVVRVVDTPTIIRVYVKTEEPFKAGDKVSGYDEETEVLAEGGWKTIADLRPGEAVCCLDPETDEIRFDVPSEISIYPPHEQRMYGLQTQALDVLVTEHHSLCIKPRYPKDSGYGLHKVKDVFGKRVRHKCDGEWSGVADDVYTIPTFEPSGEGKGHYDRASFASKEVAVEDLFYFMGIYLAEGTCYHHQSNGGYEVFIAQCPNANPVIYKEVMRLFERMGFNPHGDKRGVKVWSQQLYAWTKEHLDPGDLPAGERPCYHKRIPRWALAYGQEALGALYRGLMDGDGYRGKTARHYHSTSEGLCDDVQELVLRLGMAASVRLWQPAREERIMGREKLAQCRDRFATQIRVKRLRPTVNHGHAKTQSGQREAWVEHDGPISCVTVPSRVVLVRRNGKAYWCGHSPPKDAGADAAVSTNLEDGCSPQRMAA